MKTFYRKWGYSELKSVGFIAVLLMLLFCNDIAAQTTGNPQAFAVLKDGVLTFYYGEKPELTESKVFLINPENFSQTWSGSRGEVTKVCFDETFEQVKLKSCASMFKDCSNLQSADFSHFCTDSVKDMSRMFMNCSNLQTLNWGKFNTAKVISMREMFKKCTKLKTLNMAGFNTENVTDMGGMFGDCNALEMFDISTFNTKNVTDMGGMFQGCKKLSTLDVKHFDTSNVKEMGYMFLDCVSLQTIDVTNFKTENVTDIKCMFQGCSKLKTIDLSKFNTSKVNDMASMFLGCRSLTTLDLKSFDTQNVETMVTMFYGCSRLQNVDLSSFKTPKLTNMIFMFYGCSNLATLDITNFDTENITGMSGIFAGCKSLQTIDLSNFKTDKVTDMSGMFSGCTGLQTLDVTGFNTEKVTNMSGMFKDCSGLKTIDIKNFNTGNVTDMSEMFSGCAGLETLDLTTLKTFALTKTKNMFAHSPNLETIYVEDNFKTDKIAEDANMFSNNEKLVGAVKFSDKGAQGKDYANYQTGYFSFYYLIGGEKRPVAGEPLKTENLVLEDGKDFVTTREFTAETANYSRTVSHKWSTLCLPYDFNASGNPTANFYETNRLTGDTLYVTQLNRIVKAGEPVIVYRKNIDGKIEINAAGVKAAVNPANTSEKNYNLVGSFVEQSVPDEGYIIGNDCFWLCSDLKSEDKGNGKAVTTRAFRSYIMPNTSVLAHSRIVIGFDNNVTAINALNAAEEGDAECFDITGCRLNAPQKGVNIIKVGNKAKKIIVR